MRAHAGSLAWNPPFAPGPVAENAKDAKPIDSNEYWNYGTDEDQASANSWDGKGLPRVDFHTILKLTCWVRGTNSSSLDRERARAHQIGEPD